MDSLRRYVAERDRLHNSARQMRVTSRPVSTRKVCVDCRRVPDLFGMYREWMDSHVHGEACKWGWVCTPPKERDCCPACGGKLVEVEW